MYGYLVQGDNFILLIFLLEVRLDMLELGLLYRDT